MYSLFFGLGQLACSVGLQIVNVSTPFGYRNAFYSEFVLLGLFVPALVFAPESPCESMPEWCRSRIRRLKSLLRVLARVPRSSRQRGQGKTITPKALRQCRFV